MKRVRIRWLGGHTGKEKRIIIRSGVVEKISWTKQSDFD